MLSAYNVKYEDRKGISTRIVYAETLEKAVSLGGVLVPNNLGVEKNLIRTAISFFKGPELTEMEFVFFAESLWEATEQMGLPYSDALNSLHAASLDSEPKIAQICKDLNSLMAVGDSFGEAVDSLGVFPSMFTDLLPIAESVGKTGYILEKMGSYYTDVAEFKVAVKKEMLVPKIQIIMAIGVVLFLCLHFIPNLMHSLGEKALRPHIHGIALKVVHLSDLLRDSWGQVTFVVVAFFAGLKVASRLIYIPDSFWEKIIRIPIVGRIIILENYVYIFSALEVMISNNVPVSESLKKLEDGVTNAYFKSKIKEGRPKLENGESLSNILKIFIDPYAYQVLTIAEQSGAIDRRCASLSKKYSKELDEKMKALVAYMNPVLMLSIGLIIIALFITVLGMIDAQRAAALG